LAAILRDYRSAPITPKLKAALALVERLTLVPEDIGPGDLEALRAEGTSDQAIEDLIVVTGLFNMIDRIADALGFEIPSEEGFRGIAKILLQRGYLLPAE
jgi:alkylhydroperoxidase family enzyme